MKAYLEIDVDVSYDFQPQESATQTAGPGCDSLITLTSVMFRYIEILDKLTDVEKDSFIENIREDRAGSGGYYPW